MNYIKIKSFDQAITNFTMKRHFAILLLSCFSQSLFSHTSFFSSHSEPLAFVDNKSKKKRYKAPRYKKKVFQQRMQQIESNVRLPVNNEIKNLINDYVLRARGNTEKLLGRSAIYYPIFEKYLHKYNLPQELKHLSIVESELIPKAVSPTGASGLWQFIRSTGRLMGLTINNYVDERFDIHKSTDAAARYLAELYNRYHNWTLAIAAYNCGPGTMDRAIRKARSKNFWKVRKHLPDETKHYIPKYIAVNYVMNFYVFHDLRPQYPDYNLQLTEVLRVYKRTTFKEIAAKTGVSMKILRRLNPNYKKKIIPPNEKGYLLVLPQIDPRGRVDFSGIGVLKSTL